ncbi:lambda exonuclease family protein [Sutterella sp.]|uniref:lambda exonuclease family protein n=1 Tax=Sutterella sp. TaxID=1981025 RepID=UPI0026DF2685|nr:lambda exonuclease family protein [Sutterella sp.]MDO5532582.1 YqaJ viral recombinase family protein [Sutterella sp.]
MTDNSNPLQRGQQWFSDRCGCLTASRAAAVLQRNKRTGEPLAAYETLIDTIVAERLTGDVVGIGTTPAMQWGIDHEGDAREKYEEETGEFVELTGFIPHPEIPNFGASPDGLVGDEGLLEIKCPSTPVHMRRVMAGEVPPEYIPQMLVQCLCTGRKWVDFVDYDPRIRIERFRFFRIRFTPSAGELAEAERHCREFLAEVDRRMAKILAHGLPAKEAA